MSGTHAKSTSEVRQSIPTQIQKRIIGASMEKKNCGKYVEKYKSSCSMPSMETCVSPAMLMPSVERTPSFNILS